MAIPYIIRKKVYTTNGEKKELYYAVAKTQQARGGIKEADIIKRVSERTGFTPGVIGGVLTEVTEAIEFFLKYGFTVNIKNLGSFQTALTSKGFEHPSEITPSEVDLSRIYYIADRKLTKQVRAAGFSKIPLKSYMPEEFWEKEEDEE